MLLQGPAGLKGGEGLAGVAGLIVSVHSFKNRIGRLHVRLNAGARGAGDCFHGDRPSRPSR